MPSRSSTRCCDTSFSDVPVGTLLSGGVDSTAMLSLAAEASEKPTASFTIGFDSGGVVDERSYARLAAKRFGTEHYRDDDQRRALPRLPAGLRASHRGGCAARTGSSCSTSASGRAPRRRSSGRAGFPIPYESWFRDELRPFLREPLGDQAWSEAASDREPPRASWIGDAAGSGHAKELFATGNARRAPRSGLPQRFAPSFTLNNQIGLTPNSTTTNDRTQIQ